MLDPDQNQPEEESPDTVNKNTSQAEGEGKISAIDASDPI